jgi:hypothetical protein
MMFISALTAAALALICTPLTTASPIVAERQTAQGNFALAIGGGRFDPNYLQSFNLFYANSSAWLGQIKYQSYSEPLIVSGAGLAGNADGLGFLSIHQAPTGFQDAYIVPHQTQPIGFSTPHGSPPAGVRTQGWAFDSNGVLTNNGHNLFYACQNAEDAEINSYQIWWWGAGEPNGVSCKGPLAIKQADACARI